jgi:hypothetical protein
VWQVRAANERLISGVRNVRALAAAMLVLVADPAASAAQQLNPARAFTCARMLVAHGEYLKAADLLTAAKKDEANSFGPAHQFGSVVDSFLTGEADTDPESSVGTDESDLRKLSRARLRDALAEIVGRAQRTNVVILNEEHRSPRDRAFALELARALRPLGYSMLAAEGFFSSADPAEIKRKAMLIAASGYVRRDTGAYTSDPVFADFVRQSLAIGYRPVVYEFEAPKSAPLRRTQLLNARRAKSTTW